MKHKLGKWLTGLKQKIRPSGLIFISAILAGFFVLAPFSANVSQAQISKQTDVGLTAFSKIPGLVKGDPRDIAARLIKVFLGLLGIIAIALFVYAGFLYMTAGGKAEQVEAAKKIMKNAAVGLAIVISSYGIVSFIFGVLLGRGGPGGTGTGTGPGGPPGGLGRGLGSGIIERHFPIRNATGVPRNTKIIVTFKEKILAASIIDDNKTPTDPLDDKINLTNIKIRKTKDNRNTGPFVTNVRASVTEDQKTFVFAPLELLGSPAEPFSYTVQLGAGIKKANGDTAFGNFGAYEWQFEVSTVIDRTPPQIESVIPLSGSTNPRNVIVQITFNEAVDPTTASGTAGKFTNIKLTDTTNVLVDGTYSVSNQYRTVEFITNDKCGVNSCGKEIFCLPGGKDLQALIKAASVTNNPPEARFPYDGITDVAGNAFDGNKDGKAEGAPADNFTWAFKTTNDIDLTPPKIESVVPAKFSSNVSRRDPVKATFSKFMSYSTLNTDNLQLNDINYWTSARNDNNKTVAEIQHDELAPDTKYAPVVGSGVTDIYQNCFNPCVGP